MENEKLESLLIDYIDGNLNDAETRDVEQLILESEHASMMYAQLKEVMRLMAEAEKAEPSARMVEKFHQLIQSESAIQEERKVVPLNAWAIRVAAAVALIILGAAAGILYSRYNYQQSQLAFQRAEERRLGQVVTMITNPNSAGQRILGVKETLEEKELSDSLVQILIQTLNEDPNANVRMAALEALQNFYEQPGVRKALIESLRIQKDPVVQIALIQILVRMKEKGAMVYLRNLVKDQEVIKEVKDEANMGLLVLS